jgi:hypothetical protein
MRLSSWYTALYALFFWRSNMGNKFIQIKTTAGEPVLAGNARLTPLARSVQIKVPSLGAVLSWDRPVAVIVETAAGEQVLPVRNLTRRLQLILIGASLVGLLLGWLWQRRQVESPGTV